MAKKSKAKLIYTIEFACKIKVPAENQKAFENSLKAKELALGATVELEGASLGCLIYPDMVSGGVKYEKIDKGLYKVSAKGRYMQDDDFGDGAKIKSFRKPPTILLDDVVDQDDNNYSVDGEGDNKISIGTVGVE